MDKFSLLLSGAAPKTLSQESQDKRESFNIIYPGATNETDKLQAIELFYSVSVGEPTIGVEWQGVGQKVYEESFHSSLEAQIKYDNIKEVLKELVKTAQDPDTKAAMDITRRYIKSLAVQSPKTPTIEPGQPISQTQASQKNISPLMREKLYGEGDDCSLDLDNMDPEDKEAALDWIAAQVRAGKNYSIVTSMGAGDLLAMYSDHCLARIGGIGRRVGYAGVSRVALKFQWSKDDPAGNAEREEMERYRKSKHRDSKSHPFTPLGGELDEMFKVDLVETTKEFDQLHAKLVEVQTTLAGLSKDSSARNALNKEHDKMTAEIRTQLDPLVKHFYSGNFTVENAVKGLSVKIKTINEELKRTYLSEVTVSVIVPGGELPKSLRSAYAQALGTFNELAEYANKAGGVLTEMYVWANPGKWEAQPAEKKAGIGDWVQSAWSKISGWFNSLFASQAKVLESIDGSMNALDAVAEEMGSAAK